MNFELISGFKMQICDGFIFFMFRVKLFYFYNSKNILHLRHSDNLHIPFIIVIILRKLKFHQQKSVSIKQQQPLKSKYVSIYYTKIPIMHQPLIQVDPRESPPGPVSPKTLIVQFYQNHQNYKTQTHKFHRMTLYIFCSVQIIWLLLSYNIVTVNNYNIFIEQFESNFNNQYKNIHQKNESSFATVIQHVNSFANDYTIICWLIWLSHFGFQIVFAYIVYANRALFKQYSTGIKEMLPICFTLLTTFVIRDCLLMSVSQVVQYDLGQILVLIQNQKDLNQISEQNFNIFISKSMNLATNLNSEFSTLEIISYLQQICDGAIICVLTVQIFRIYSAASKCQKNQQQLISKKLYAIQPCKGNPSNGRHHSQFGSKVSQESQYATSLHNDGFFHYIPKITTSQKQIDRYLQANLGGHSLRSIKISEQNSYNSRFHKRQHQSNMFKVKTMKSSGEQLHLRKLKKSGSCNYLKGSQEISEEQVIQLNRTHRINEGQAPPNLLLQMGLSEDRNLDKNRPRRQRTDSLDACLFNEGNVLFKV